MASLFFWRRRNPPAAATVAPATPVIPAPAVRVADAIPIDPLRQVLAHALGDESAANPAATPTAPHMALLLAASQQIAQIGVEPRYTPRRPSLLPQLLEAVDDEDASLRTMARIIQQDPQLTGDLLRTANSAMYRVSSTPVESVERAAALLGTQGLRALIASSLLQPLAQDGTALGKFGEITWSHATCCGSAAEAWAGRTQEADPFAAHLVALLHGLGTTAVYRVLVDCYAAQSALRMDGSAAVLALTTNAAVTARRIALDWGLSARTQEALEAQSVAAPVHAGSPLTRALQFGLTAGSLAILCQRKCLALGDALPVLAARGFTGTQIERIWDRMAQAYVRP
jgi:HD-like signal output (HDOD) protein